MGGLRVYQWLAVASVVGGAVLTTVDGAGPALRVYTPGGAVLLPGLLMGLVAAAAMGMDFPGSNRRFSRLAPAGAPPGDRGSGPT